MSTGADCRIYEEKPGVWKYDLQDYPYGATEHYTTYGPFPTFGDARGHLDRKHANPGGYTVTALPGCQHGRLFDDTPSEVFGQCYLCGDQIRLKAKPLTANVLYARLLPTGVTHRSKISNLVQATLTDQIRQAMDYQGYERPDPRVVKEITEQFIEDFLQGRPGPNA